MKKFIYLFAFILFVHSTLMVENCMSQWVNMNSPANRIEGITSINNNIFITAPGQGVLTSSNGGVNWNAVNNGLPDLYLYRITSSANNLFVSKSGTPPKVYVSANLGLNWTEANNGLTSYVTALFASGSYVYAGTSEGAYYTTNNGANWILSNLSGVTPSCFIKSGSILFAGTYSNGIYKSTDNGFTWAGCSNGLTTLSIYALGVLGTDIFAGTNYGGAMYKTTNNGANWSEANSGIIHLVIRGIASQNGHIFACANDSYGCIYHSTNAGLNWIVKNQGFGTLIPNFNCLYITNDYVYAGTNSKNLWKRSYQDIIGINNISSEIPDKFSLYQNYPNPFNPVTKIKFDVANIPRWRGEGGWNTTIRVFDVTGREVQTLVNESLLPGSYEVTFDAGKNELNSGIYFCTLYVNGFSQTIKMLLIK